MKLGELNGYEFHFPTSGGKAGNGHNVTGTIQVRRDNRIVKQFRFKVADFEDRQRAVKKAKDFAATTPAEAQR
jgi:hypothetical protein